MSVINIGPWQLALCLLFVAVAGTGSAVLRLGLERDLAWGTARAFAQLFPQSHTTTVFGKDVRSPNTETDSRSPGADVGTAVGGRVTDATGLPVGIKSAVGQSTFWTELADHMAATGRGPDYVSVDGGEGGTGAGPLVFTDNVALPFFHGFAVVRSAFVQAGIAEQIVFAGAGKLGLPSRGALALSLGADVLSVGREAMLAVGCIQAQKCHTGHCPTGVATQSRWLERGLDPTSKGVRVGNYVKGLRKELLRLSHACGVEHPSMLGPDAVAVVCDGRGMVDAHEWYGVEPHHGTGAARLAEVAELMRTR